MHIPSYRYNCHHCEEPLCIMFQGRICSDLFRICPFWRQKYLANRSGNILCFRCCGLCKLRMYRHYRPVGKDRSHQYIPRTCKKDLYNWFGSNECPKHCQCGTCGVLVVGAWGGLVLVYHTTLHHTCNRKILWKFDTPVRTQKSFVGYTCGRRKSTQERVHCYSQGQN